MTSCELHLCKTAGRWVWEVRLRGGEGGRKITPEMSETKTRL